MNKSSQFRLLNHHLRKCGFSLMEIMIIMLVVAVIAAATTPMITSRIGLGSVSNSDLLWQKENGSNRIFFYNGENRKAIVGSYKYKATSIAPSNPSLVLVGKGPIIFHKPSDDTNGSNSYTNVQLYINQDDNHNFIGLYHVKYISTLESLKNTVAIGREINFPTIGEHDGYSVLLGNKNDLIDYSVVVGNMVNDSTGSSNDAKSNSVALGNQSHANRRNAIAIGFNAKAGGVSSGTAEAGPVVIGANSYVGSSNPSNDKSVAINGSVNGANSVAIAGKVDGNSYNSIAILGEVLDNNSIAIGAGAKIDAINGNSIAIGNGAKVNADNSIAIGNNIEIYESGQVVIGNKDSASANIIGLEITKKNNGSFEIGDNEHNKINLKVDALNIRDIEKKQGFTIDDYIKTVLKDKNFVLPEGVSDIRLKNVGERYTAGLDEIKRLELFNYTYKNDDKKIPHVGVIAQDLQKIFPNAVTKGDDGYLRIRMEDMFYALINAVKELDKKLVELSNQVKDYAAELANLKSTYIEQQKMLEQRQIALAERSKQLDELSAKVDALKNEKPKKETKVEKVKSEHKEKVKKVKKVKEKKLKNVEEEIN